MPVQALLNLSAFSTDLIIDMSNNRSLFGNFGVAIFFTLLFIAAGVFIGLDLRQNLTFRPQQAETEEETQTEKSNEAIVGGKNPLTGKVTQLQDSIKVLLARQSKPQIETQPVQATRATDPGPPPPGYLIVEPTLIIAGASKSVLNDKVLISVSLNSFNDSTEAEVTIRKVRNPLEKAMEYGEVLRLFYASTGRKESFRYVGDTYYIHILKVGKFGTQMGVRFSLYKE